MKTETLLTVATLGLAAWLIASVSRKSKTPAATWSPMDIPVTFGSGYGGDPSNIFTGPFFGGGTFFGGAGR